MREASDDAEKQDDVCKEPGMNTIARFATDEYGATAIEYGMIATLALFSFPLLMAYAASSDLLTRKIANWLVLLLTAAYFAMAFLAHIPLSDIGMSVAAAAVV